MARRAPLAMACAAIIRLISSCTDNTITHQQQKSKSAWKTDTTSAKCRPTRPTETAKRTPPARGMPQHRGCHAPPSDTPSRPTTTPDIRQEGPSRPVPRTANMHTLSHNHTWHPTTPLVTCHAPPTDTHSPTPTDITTLHIRHDNPGHSAVHGTPLPPCPCPRRAVHAPACSRPSATQCGTRGQRPRRRSAR